MEFVDGGCTCSVHSPGFDPIKERRKGSRQEGGTVRMQDE